MTGSDRPRRDRTVDIDDRIVAALAREGPRSLATLQDGLTGTEKGVNYPVEYVLFRCQQLRRQGVIEYRSDGTIAVTRSGARSYGDVAEGTAGGSGAATEESEADADGPD